MNTIESIGHELAMNWGSPQLLVLSNTRFTPAEFVFLKEMLTPVERSKRERFRFTRDRDSYTVVHGLLRYILGSYFTRPPLAVGITYDANGKPYVSEENRKMFFNLSHSGEVSAIAFDPVHEIGVDVEEIKPDFEYRPIIDAFFTNEDIRNITASEGSSLRGFYKTWTRKEALLKAIGTGITERLDIGVSEPVSSGFSLNTVMFGDCYVITTATNPGSGAVKTLVK